MMNKVKKVYTHPVAAKAAGWIFLLLMMICGERKAFAEITSSICTDPKLTDIPVGQFMGGVTMPEVHKGEMRITQGYHTSYNDGWWSQEEKKWMWGHDGIDIREVDSVAGEHQINSIHDGLMVVSQQEGAHSGWGESMILATRTNQYSEQILTYHYHHLYKSGKVGGKDYVTSRLYNACDQVTRGSEIAREGATGGDWKPHLHLSVRRWKNLADLQTALKNNGAGIFGHGYSFGDDTKLANFLDPLGLLYGTFSDFQANDPNFPNAWALQYVQNMRWNGIEFGLFNGKFGADQLAKRREVARWLKIAAKQQSYVPQSATFPGDMPTTDSDSCYVEALTLIPKAGNTVINPKATCQQGAKKFCPDNNISRAEALKMVVLTFYADEYFKIYNDWIWTAVKNQAMGLLTKFQDVGPNDWFASYVYYGVARGIVKNQQFFRPGDPVNRAEISKWVMEGYWFKFGNVASPCNNVVCPTKSYCDYGDGKCKPLSQCIPSETQQCEVGGGYDPCTAGTCQPGAKKQQSCQNGQGTQEQLCSAECAWGAWNNCKIQGCQQGQQMGCGQCGTTTCDGNGQFGQCQNEGICKAGESQSQSCNGNGTQLKICNNSCTWGQWESCSVLPPPPQKDCTPGDTQPQFCNNGQGTQTRLCNVNGQWDAWGNCIANNPPPPQKECNAGDKQDQSCNNGQGTQTRWCNNSGLWDTWGSCFANNPPPPQKVCTPGDIESQVCINGNSSQTRNCDWQGQWGAWGSCYANPDPPPQKVCPPGVVSTQSCNNGQGNQDRTCNAQGQWGAWGACINNQPPPPQKECNPGDTQDQICNGGKQTRTCDWQGQWSGWGQCILDQPPQKDCNPWETGEQSCNNGQGTQTRTCNGQGTWGAWGICIDNQPPQSDAGAPPPPQKDCNPWETGEQSCNNGQGTQTRTCDQQGAWGAWGACVNNQPQCVCQSGSCCDGCKYYSAAQSCDLTYTYQCQGPNKGQDSQKAMVKKFCSGNSADCTGQAVQYGWQTVEDCSPAQVCQMQNGQPQCIGACQNTFTASSKQACYGNPQGSGNPTLCLEIQNQSGSSGQYRLCKQGGTFGNNFTYQLKDENNFVFFGQMNGPAGISCTNWQSFNVSYIKGYGALNGAGLMVHVASPAGCVQAACQYQTGEITIAKTCN